MVSRFLKLLPAAGAVLLLAGCQFWTLGGSVFTAPKGAFTIRVPAGWSYTRNLGADLLMTRDGVIMQAITLNAVPLKKALPFTERELAPHLSPYELAETIAGDLRSDEDRIGLTVLTNEPAIIGGVDGFKLTFTYTDARGLRMMETRCGAVHDGELWTLSLRAPRRHYHHRDLPAFEAAVASFQFGPAAGSGS